MCREGVALVERWCVLVFWQATIVKEAIGASEAARPQAVGVEEVDGIGVDVEVGVDRHAKVARRPGILAEEPPDGGIIVPRPVVVEVLGLEFAAGVAEVVGGGAGGGGDPVGAVAVGVGGCGAVLGAITESGV